MITPLLFLLLMAIGLLGLICHWLNIWARGRTEQSFLTYLRCEKWRSLGSIGSLAAAVAGLMSSGHADINDPVTFGLVFLAGYTLDSAINKASDEII